ncbi:MAG: hypothetical protein AAGC93_02595 [Cyanobacteria bacterium P01_F01_bin.53]
MDSFIRDNSVQHEFVGPSQISPNLFPKIPSHVPENTTTPENDSPKELPVRRLSKKTFLLDDFCLNPDLEESAFFNTRSMVVEISRSASLKRIGAGNEVVDGDPPTPDLASPDLASPDLANKDRVDSEPQESSLQCCFTRMVERGNPIVLAQVNVYLEASSAPDLSALLRYSAELNARLPRLRSGVRSDESGHYFLSFYGQSRGEVTADNMSRFLSAITRDLGVFFAYAKAFNLKVKADVKP